MNRWAIYGLCVYVGATILKRLFWPSIRELWLLLGDEIRFAKWRANFKRRVRSR